jgi:hypothetical protein
MSTIPSIALQFGLCLSRLPKREAGVVPADDVGVTDLANGCSKMMRVDTGAIISAGVTVCLGLVGDVAQP